MLSGVTTICFAGSYTVALLLEISRLWFRSGVRGAVMIGFAAAGLVAHTAFLYHDAVNRPQSPLSSQRDWFLLAAWVLVVIYLYLMAYHPRHAFGLFLLPLVLALIAVAKFVASPEPYPQGPASDVWGAVHGIAILMTTVVVFVGFVTGLMYLVQNRRLKQKKPPTRGLSLPSLEWLQRANSRALVISLLLLAVGVVSGIVLTSLSGVKPIPWTDPVILSTLCMFAWLLIAVLINALYRPAHAGRKVAYLTLVNFVFLVTALAVGLSFDTAHGGSRDAPRPSASPGAVGRLDSKLPLGAYKPPEKGSQ
jgi:ABC-type uncharacterized transport system permease subunit